ncbi:MAG: head GIN domain-containing protein [Oceanihabitans sp.]
MTTLIKIIITSLISLLFVSCNFDVNFNNGINGTGEVTTTNRNLEGDFTAIKVSHGLNLYLTQGDTNTLKVEANSNLHELIKTEIENGTLLIYADKNIGSADAKKIALTFKDVSSIKSTSGSDVFSTNTITTNKLNLNTTSGSDMNLSINVQDLTCKSTSGSDLILRGSANAINAQATSGSDIDAENLKTITSHVKATSGAGITVNTKKELYAKASSGGDVTYYGNPTIVNKSDGVSGSISKK